MSTNNIERFDLCADDCSNDCMTVMQPAAEGAFVRYSDLPVSLPDAISVVEQYLHDELGGGTTNRNKWMRAAAFTIIDRLRSLSPDVAPTTSEPTVEDCLRELREVFPGEAVLIEFHDCTGIKGYQGNGYVKISGGTVHSAAPTLSKCMAQVRQFVKEGK